MLWGECHRTSPVRSKHWFSAVRQRTITWIDVDSSVFRHVAALEYDDSGVHIIFLARQCNRMPTTTGAVTKMNGVGLLIFILLLLHDDAFKWKSDFRLSGPSSGESTGHWRIPLTKGLWWSFNDIFDVSLNTQLNKQSSRQWFETPAYSYTDYHSFTHFISQQQIYRLVQCVFTLGLHWLLSTSWRYGVVFFRISHAKMTWNPYPSPVPPRLIVWGKKALFNHDTYLMHQKEQTNVYTLNVLWRRTGYE